MSEGNWKYAVLDENENVIVEFEGITTVTRDTIRKLSRHLKSERNIAIKALEWALKIADSTQNETSEVCDYIISKTGCPDDRSIEKIHCRDCIQAYAMEQGNL